MTKTEFVISLFEITMDSIKKIIVDSSKFIDTHSKTPPSDKKTK
jgi:hypothetical protein